MAGVSCKHKILQSPFICLHKIRKRYLAKVPVVQLPTKTNSLRKGELAKVYNCAEVESGWYQEWEEQKLFHFKTKNDAERFCMILPPPNVTGNLHLGHAFTAVIQDAIIRWHRMQGHDTLWVPGCDHAGIATQVIVEKMLWKQYQKTLHDIDKDTFMKFVWDWKEEKEQNIYSQLRQLGSSLDWTKAVFTMDPIVEKAVKQAFIQLHEEDLIQRKNAMVNWCCHLRSTISDIEVEHIDIMPHTKLTIPGYEKPVQFGHLVNFAYPVHDSRGKEEVIVSTTRPETMFGDAAVAVHPSDGRYTHLHNRYLVHPFNNSVLPIICDEAVDPNFGTGAVKITPAHDFLDYEISLRHNLNQVTVIDDKGCMESNCHDFQGKPRFEARVAVIQALKDLGLLRDIANHSCSLSVCSRTGDVIEPRLKPQWFLDCSDAAQQSIEAVKNGQLKIIPKDFENVWCDWMKNIREWCISRQLVWGHSIPVYRVSIEGENENEMWISANSYEEALTKAANKYRIEREAIKLKQDSDVLDTWFSSALLPFAVFGWPHKNENLSRFYPLSLMETGHDILLFWVARMVILGLKLTGQLPFKEVLLHGVICDAKGRKMSKSLGNIIDPMDIINGASAQILQKQIFSSNDAGILSKKEMKIALETQKLNFPEGIPAYGTDTLRFTICCYNIKNHFMNMNTKLLDENRRFCNKIWQVSRFIFQNCKEMPYSDPLSSEMQVDTLREMDQWILSCLSECIVCCNDAFKSHDLHLATRSLYSFLWFQFCDVYVESVKPRLWKGNETEQQIVLSVLKTSLETFLLALAPFMPYLSEELYQHLPWKINTSSIHVVQYPLSAQYSHWKNDTVEAQVNLMLEVVKAIRNLRKCAGLGKERPSAFITCSTKQLQDDLKLYLPEIETLAQCGSVVSIHPDELPQEVFITNVINENISTHLNCQEIPDADKVIKYVTGKKIKLEKELQKIISLMKTLKFSKKASKSAQEDYFIKKNTLEADLQQLNELKKNLEKLCK